MSGFAAPHDHVVDSEECIDYFPFNILLFVIKNNFKKLDYNISELLIIFFCKLFQFLD